MGGETELLAIVSPNNRAFAAELEKVLGEFVLRERARRQHPTCDV